MKSITDGGKPPIFRDWGFGFIRTPNPNFQKSRDRLRGIQGPALRSRWGQAPRPPNDLPRCRAFAVSRSVHFINDAEHRGIKPERD